MDKKTNQFSSTWSKIDKAKEVAVKQKMAANAPKKEEVKPNGR